MKSLNFVDSYKQSLKQLLNIHPASTNPHLPSQDLTYLKMKITITAFVTTIIITPEVQWGSKIWTSLEF